jgi:hypothetical protein
VGESEGVYTKSHNSNFVLVSIPALHKAQIKFYNFSLKKFIVPCVYIILKNLIKIFISKFFDPQYLSHYGLLVCDAMQQCGKAPTFWRTMLPPFSPHHNMMSQPRRLQLEISITLKISSITLLVLSKI